MEDLKRHAGDLGLNATAFDTCLDEGKFAGLVQEDLDQGKRYGVSSTPTIFINGRPIIGAAAFELFDTVVREELAATEPLQ